MEVFLLSFNPKTMANDSISHVLRLPNDGMGYVLEILVCSNPRVEAAVMMPTLMETLAPGGSSNLPRPSN